ncbi:MAG TPA: LysR family transcriptional regulator [Solirubrobacteraceae bacterium]|nr:LysR family transcriptional regulator [Solirubrobacteraceae bacterium]
MDIDLAHIRSFLAVVRYGGYHRAADALHLTQPAISRHVRRLEQQLGETLFERVGRGVELTAFGERAAAELAEVLDAHDRALVQLARQGDGQGPFMLGTIEHIVDPMLPAMLGAIRAYVGDRSVTMRVDRSRSLATAFAHGEVDAAIVLDPGEVAGALDFGPLTLRWYVGAGVAQSEELPDPLPMVAYDEPCHMRDLALARVRSLGLGCAVGAQSPHLSGIQSAVRSGLGYALLADGGDGLRAVTRGPLAEPIQTRLWLLVRGADQALAAPLRAAMWRATTDRLTVAA